jgi:hypothetical protein
LSASCTQNAGAGNQIHSNPLTATPSRACAYWSQNSSLAQCSGVSGFVGMPLTPLRAANCTRNERHVGICYQLPMALTRLEPSEKPYPRCTQLSSCPCRRQAREAHPWDASPPAIGHPLASVLGVVVGLVPVCDEEGGGFVRRVVDLLRFRSRNPTVRRGFGASTRPSLCSGRPFSVARDPSPCPCATPPAGEAALAMARYSASLTRPARHSVSRVAWSHSRRPNVLVCRQRFNLGDISLRQFNL